MRLVLLCMNYAPETTGIAPFTTGLCEYLGARGHQVTVATTFPHYPRWRTQAPYQGRWLSHETRNGVTIRRSRVRVPRRASTRERIAYDTSLAVGALATGLRVGQVDLVLAVEPPIQVGASARLLAAACGVPYVVWVQDLALEAALSVGMIKSNLALRLAGRLEAWAYAAAERVLVISTRFAGNLERKGVAPDRLVYLPNWVDTDEMLAADGSELRRAHGVPADAILVLHSGNMGAKQQLENVLAAAGQLRAHAGIVFWLVGDGSSRDALQDKAERAGLSNVRFLPLQPRATVPSLMAAADILVLNQHPGIVDAVIPSKLLTYMAGGRPVLVAAHYDSEASRLVRMAGSGVWVPPGHPGALAAAVLELAADRQARAELGACGRAFVREHFARESVLADYEAWLLAAARRGARA